MEDHDRLPAAAGIAEEHPRLWWRMVGLCRTIAPEVAAWTRPLIDGMGFSGGALREGSLLIPDGFHSLNKPLSVIYLYPRLPVNAILQDTMENSQ